MEQSLIWISGIAGVLTICGGFAKIVMLYNRVRILNRLLRFIEEDRAQGGYKLSELISEIAHGISNVQDWQLMKQISEWEETVGEIETTRRNSPLSQPVKPPRSYSRLLKHLPEKFRDEFGDELLDHISDGLEDRADSNKSTKKFIFSETLNLVFMIGKKRVFAFRSKRQSQFRKD